MILESLLCIAQAVYFEGRNQSFEGQLAIAHVIDNRVESERFPDTHCDVIHEGPTHSNGLPLVHQCEFSFWCDGLKETIRNPEAYDIAITAAVAVYFGLIPDITHGSLFYHADYVKPEWSEYKFKVKIDNHLFYAVED